MADCFRVDMQFDEAIRCCATRFIGTTGQCLFASPVQADVLRFVVEALTSSSGSNTIVYVPPTLSERDFVGEVTVYHDFSAVTRRSNIHGDAVTLFLDCRDETLPDDPWTLLAEWIDFADEQSPCRLVLYGLGAAMLLSTSTALSRVGDRVFVVIPIITGSPFDDTNESTVGFAAFRLVAEQNCVTSSAFEQSQILLHHLVTSPVQLRNPLALDQLAVRLKSAPWRFWKCTVSKRGYFKLLLDFLTPNPLPNEVMDLTIDAIGAAAGNAQIFVNNRTTSVVTRVSPNRIRVTIDANLFPLRIFGGRWPCFDAFCLFLRLLDGNLNDLSSDDFRNKAARALGGVDGVAKVVALPFEKGGLDLCEISYCPQALQAISHQNPATLAVYLAEVVRSVEKISSHNALARAFQLRVHASGKQLVLRSASLPFSGEGARRFARFLSREVFADCERTSEVVISTAENMVLAAIAATESQLDEARTGGWLSWLGFGEPEVQGAKFDIASGNVTAVAK